MLNLGPRALDGLAELVAAADEFVRAHPGEAVRLESAVAAFLEATRPADTAVCRHCSKLVVEHDGRWTHLSGERGCRAASFDPERGWNDSLDPRWLAAPARPARR